jgi:hypothetical protein
MHLAQYRQNSGSLPAKSAYPGFENDPVLTPQPVTRTNTTNAVTSGFGSQKPSDVSERFGQRPQSSSGQSANGGEGEDIKAKLARYKREREELEQVRLQLRAKNQNAVARQSPAGGTMRMNSLSLDDPRNRDLETVTKEVPLMFEQTEAN